MQLRKGGRWGGGGSISRQSILVLVAVVLLIASVAWADCPELVGSVDTPGNAKDVAVSGAYAYVADHGGGIRVIDVSTPSAPVEVGSTDAGYAGGVAVAGSYAYVAAGLPLGLRVIDVSTPSTPVMVGFFDTPGWARDVAVSGGYATVPGITTSQCLACKGVVLNPHSSWRGPGFAFSFAVAFPFSAASREWEWWAVLDSNQRPPD